MSTASHAAAGAVREKNVTSLYGPIIDFTICTLLHSADEKGDKI